MWIIPVDRASNQTGFPPLSIDYGGVRGNLSGQCPLTSPVTSLLLSPYLFIFLNFLLNFLPGFHVFTGAEQTQAPPCCPLVPVPANTACPITVSGFFWALFPWFLMAWAWNASAGVPGMSVHGPARGVWFACAWSSNLATKSTEDTCVSQELLKDLLYLLPGREPRILFYFLSYLYF